METTETDLQIISRLTNATFRDVSRDGLFTTHTHTHTHAHAHHTDTHTHIHNVPPKKKGKKKKIKRC